MFVRTLCALSLVLLPAVASAVPLELQHQGRLLDSTGIAIDGSHDVTVRIYAVGDSTPVWTETHTGVNFDSGYFHLQLGTVSDIDPDAFAGDTDLELTLQLDTEAELPAQPLSSVPTALVADRALSLVDGADLVVGSVTAGGEEVIAADGTISFDRITNAPVDTLDGLSSSCSSGDVALFDGTSWTCTAQLPAVIPATLLDGTIASANLLFGTGEDTISEGNHTHAAADLTGNLADLTGNLAASRIDGQLDAANLPSSIDAGLITGTLDSSTLPASALAPTGADAGTAAVSCRSLLEDYPNTASGTHWLDPDGGSSHDAFEAYCDMDYDGGGWTLVGIDMGGTSNPGRLASGTNINGQRVQSCDSATRSWAESCWVIDRAMFSHNTDILVKAGADLDGNGDVFDDQLSYSRLRFANSRSDLIWTRLVGNEQWAPVGGQIYNFTSESWVNVPTGNANHHSQIPITGWLHWNVASVAGGGAQDLNWGRNDIPADYHDPEVGAPTNIAVNNGTLLIEVYVRGR